MASMPGEITVRLDADLRTMPNHGRFVLELREEIRVEEIERIRDQWNIFWEDAPARPKLLILTGGKVLRSISEPGEDFRG